MMCYMLEKNVFVVLDVLFCVVMFFMISVIVFFLGLFLGLFIVFVFGFGIVGFIWDDDEEML